MNGNEPVIGATSKASFIALSSAWSSPFAVRYVVKGGFVTGSIISKHTVGMFFFLEAILVKGGDKHFDWYQVCQTAQNCYIQFMFSLT